MKSCLDCVNYEECYYGREDELALVAVDGLNPETCDDYDPAEDTL